MTLATRVRIEVLKAIAGKFSRNEERIYLTQTEPRPYIRVVNTTDRSEKVLIYADAVSKYGLRLEREDLAKAYTKAGNNFYGQLAHLFVILFDDDDQEEIERRERQDKKKLPPKQDSRKRPAGSDENSGTPTKKQNKNKKN